MAVMNILFITSSRIGDAVLSSGLLSYIAQTYPDAKVTIACGHIAAPLFEGYPNLARLIAMKKQKRSGHWLTLWKQVVGTRWDMVVDLRNSAVSRLIRAKRRYIFGGHIDQSLHKAEQNAAVMKLDFVPDLALWLSDEQRRAAQRHIPDGAPVLAVGPTANWIGKTWPEERFIEVIKSMTADDGVMAGARVAVFAAPGEEGVARRVLASIPENRAIDLIAKTDIGVSAAALSLCNFYLGNDSGLMHCAAALGVPTLGVFGPSYPHLYRPYSKSADYISTPESFDELIAFDGYHPDTCGCLMESLTMQAVQDKVVEIFSRA